MFSFLSQRHASGGGSITAPSYDPATLTASGKVSIGSAVVVQVNGSAVGSATVDASGMWTYVFASPPAGGSIITAAVTSTSGQVVVSGSVTVTFDSTAVTFDNTSITFDRIS